MAGGAVDNIVEEANVKDIPGIVKVLENVGNSLAKNRNAADLTKLLNDLKGAVLGLTNLVKDNTEETAKLNKKTRETDDELDEYKQKNLKGKFIITSTPEKLSDMKKQEDVAPKDLTKHIAELVKSKYQMDLLESDIDSCHFLPRGGIFFSLWNLRPGSAFQNLAESIKKGGNKGLNHYVNFMLTKRRSALLYEVRKLKRNEDISRFYSDEDGNISMKVIDENEKATKLSSYHKTKNSPVLTFLPSEVHEKVREMKRK